MSQQTFRSAFNGFNREDVVSYIEYLNAQHAAEINQLNSELVFLRNKATQAAPVPEAPVTTETDDLIEQQAARIRELFDRCKEQEQQIAKLTADLEQASHQQTTCKSHADEELEAYRRAERTERLARERAEQMYHQANAVLADAMVKVDDAAALISQISDKVSNHLIDLQSAVTDSKQALCDAVATMSAIRPETETN
jgi:Spy/CpxP family protein refolding chaperone